jgi:hypothetical protein
LESLGPVGQRVEPDLSLVVHLSSLGAAPETALYRALEHSGDDVSLAEMDSGPVGT